MVTLQKLAKYPLQKLRNNITQYSQFTEQIMIYEAFSFGTPWTNKSLKILPYATWDRDMGLNMTQLHMWERRSNFEGHHFKYDHLQM